MQHANLREVVKLFICTCLLKILIGYIVKLQES